MLGLDALSMNALDGALVDYDAPIELNPGRADTFFWRGGVERYFKRRVSINKR